MKCMTLSIALTIPGSMCTEKVSALQTHPKVLYAFLRIGNDGFHIAPNLIGFIQDTVHVAVKLKSCLLKPGIALGMRKFIATGDHLSALTTKFQIVYD